jgi:hypothetical protein
MAVRKQLFKIVQGFREVHPVRSPLNAKVGRVGFGQPGEINRTTPGLCDQMFEIGGGNRDATRRQSLASHKQEYIGRPVPKELCALSRYSSIIGKNFLTECGQNAGAGLNLILANGW